MRITDLLKQSAIELNVSVANKQAAIDKLVSLHDKSGNLVNAAEYKKGILAREEMGTTAAGFPETSHLKFRFLFPASVKDTPPAQAAPSSAPPAAPFPELHPPE